jgi:hypothetical protein
VAINPVNQLTKNQAVNVSSKVTLTPIQSLTKNQSINLSSKATVNSVGQKNGNFAGAVNLSSKVTVNLVSNIVKTGSVLISSRVTVSPFGIPTRFGFAQLSSKATVTVFAIKSFTPVAKFGVANLKSFTTLTPVVTPTSIVCPCPDWDVDDYVTCNWSAADYTICDWLVTGGIGIASLPFTIPVFRLFDLPVVTNTPVFTWSGGVTGTYFNSTFTHLNWSVNTIPDCLWIDIGTSTQQWVRNTYGLGFVLPYTLPVFRLFNYGYNQDICNYQINVTPNVQYDVGNVAISVYSNNTVAASGWSRKGCE